MSPSDLVELAEIKDLMKDRQYRGALQKLELLFSKYPDDRELSNLIDTCQIEGARNNPNWGNATKTKELATKTRESTTPLPQWEYCELEVIIGGPITGTKANITHFKASGSHLQTNGNYGDLFAKLGMAGWELVTSSARIEAGLTGKHKINYIFKRLIL